jgi:hypothetical protein
VRKISLKGLEQPRASSLCYNTALLKWIEKTNALSPGPALINCCRPDFLLFLVMPLRSALGRLAKLRWLHQSFKQVNTCPGKFWKLLYISSREVPEQFVTNTHDASTTKRNQSRSFRRGCEKTRKLERTSMGENIGR